jgi:hypothetical protein
VETEGRPVSNTITAVDVNCDWGIVGHRRVLEHSGDLRTSRCCCCGAAHEDEVLIDAPSSRREVILGDVARSRRDPSGGHGAEVLLAISGSAVAAAADLGIPLVVLALLGARGDAAGVGDEEPPTRRS